LQFLTSSNGLPSLDFPGAGGNGRERSMPTPSLRTRGSITTTIACRKQKPSATGP